jgi:hypothetical protein
MEKRDAIVKLYQDSYAQILDCLKEIDKNRKIYPLWTIREIVAHLSGWDDAAIGFLEALLKDEVPPTPAMRGIDVYNEETVSTREGLSYDQVVREYKETRGRLISLIQKASGEVLLKKSVLPWGGEDTFEFIGMDLTEHEMSHVADLRKFIDQS